MELSKTKSDSYLSAAEYIGNTAKNALQISEEILQKYLPNGRRVGNEWISKNPKRNDTTEGSFKVNCSTGKWADFACGKIGGDLVSLVAYLNDLHQIAAVGKLVSDFNLNSPGSVSSVSKEKYAVNSIDNNPTGRNHSEVFHGVAGVSEATIKSNDWVPILPVPQDAPPPPKKHYKFGQPARYWIYRNRSSEVLGLIYRFELPACLENAAQGKKPKKEMRPLTYCRNQITGDCQWKWKGLPTPRPLYQLDLLEKYHLATVLVTEGEKSSAAAAQLAPTPEFVTTTWPNGASAAAQADWSPLAGRKVLLWPDNDEPGKLAMEKVAKLIRIAGATEVKIINLMVLYCLKEVV